MTRRIFRVTAVLALAAGALAGCGKTGALERPAPMFGEQAKADYDANKTAQAAKAAQAKANQADEQNNTVFDPASGPPTDAPNAAPLPGVSSPFAPGPRTAGQSQNDAPDQ